MALNVDFGLISKGLLGLINDGIALKWDGVPPGVFVASPPNSPTGEDDYICSFFLFHVIENAHLRNAYLADYPQANVKATPLAVDLYYLMSVRPKDEAVTSDLYIDEIQKLMTYGMKVLHDYPIVIDGTKIYPTSPDYTDEEVDLPAGSKLNIVLLQKEPNDIFQYWSSGSEAPQLTAFYKVSVVMVDAEDPPARPERVLTYRIPVFVRGFPSIDAVEHTGYIRLADGRQLRRVFQPAQVSVEPVAVTPPTPPPPVLPPNVPVIRGQNFSGVNVAVQLSCEVWEGGIATLPLGMITDATRISLSLPDEVSVQPPDPDEAPVLLRLIPGVYTVRVVVTSEFMDNTGAPQTIEQPSNLMPFMIVPQVAAVTEVATTPHVVYQLTGGYFEANEAAWLDPATDIEFWIGTARLTYLPATNEAAFLANPHPGKFIRRDSPDTATALHFQRPASLEEDKIYPLRIIVRGVEALPTWFSYEAP